MAKKKVVKKVKEKLAVKEEPIVKEEPVVKPKIEKANYEKYSDYLKINEIQFQLTCPKCETYINIPYDNPVCPVCKNKI